ncbi:hypothetical protein FoTM2_016625 [Fusarium oxysporum f. sp. vasinfectum]|nr:hypothetical protein FoTM2_016625 [Fusarium oxysporum f. sp. vasinfectum]
MVIGIATFLLATSTLMVVLRVVSGAMVKQFRLDDMAAIASLLTMIACGTAITSMFLGVRILLHAITILHQNVILINYYRLLSASKLRPYCIGAMVLIVLWGGGVCILVFVVCIPLAGVWDPNVDGKCVPHITIMWWFNGVFNSIGDLFILTLPIPTLWRLQSPRRQKTYLLFVFSLGFLTVGISITRMRWLKMDTDMTWWNVTPALWSLGELTSAISCSCLPFFKPLTLRVKSFMSRATVGGTHPQMTGGEGDKEANAHSSVGAGQTEFIQNSNLMGIENGKVLLVNTGGKTQALGAKCTHYGAPLAKGVLTSDGRITCPWHGACFNAKTSDIEDAPALDHLPVFQVAERGGARCTGFGSVQIDNVVVVGGGSGTLGVVESLRENGYKGGITVISNEGYYPIDRTKLSKALMADFSKLQWRNKDFYEGGSIKFVQGEVNNVDFSGRFVTTNEREKIGYTKLVLATGRTPRRLPLEGFKNLDNVFTLRNVHDAKKIADHIGDKGKKIVVVGSSFIGIELAVATAGDNDVTVIGMENALEGKGVKFDMGASVDKAEPSASDESKVGSVSLKDGTKLEADLIVLSVGVAPATQFLKNNSGIKLEDDGSIKINVDYSVQGLKDGYAIGDIAKFPYHGPGGDGKHARIEHWNVAQKAGRIAANHIVNPGGKTEHFIPIFWSALRAQLRYCGNTMASVLDDLVLQG